MRRVDYAGREAHVEEHQRLFEQVADLMARSTTGERLQARALLLFLRDGLTAHIMGTDHAVGRRLNQMNVRP
jgi:hemerythrin